MSEMVELAARAVDEELSRLGVGLKLKTRRAIARAVISAIREPSEEMLWATPTGFEDEARRDWQAMIDAALK